MARYSFVVCRSSGEPVGEALAAKSRQLTRALNQPATATISLQLGDDLASFVVPGLRLKVYRSATPAEAAVGITRTLVFYGQLPPLGLMLDAGSDTLTAMYKDPSWVLSRRFVQGLNTVVAILGGGTGIVSGLGDAISDSFAATKQGAILQGVLTRINTFGDTWIVPGGDVTTPLRDRAYPQGKNVAELFAEMTNVIDGCDWEVSPLDYYSLAGSATPKAMGTLSTYQKKGTDRPGVIFAYGPGTIANVAGAQLAYQDVTNATTFIGTAQDGSTVIKGYNVASPDWFLEEWGTLPDVSNAQTVLERSTGNTTESYYLRPIVTVTNPLPDAPRFLVDYFIGDTVRVQVKRGAFVQSTSPRVMAVVMDITQEGAENVALTLS